MRCVWGFLWCPREPAQGARWDWAGFSLQEAGTSPGRLVPEKFLWVFFSRQSPGRADESQPST